MSDTAIPEAPEAAAEIDAAPPQVADGLAPAAEAVADVETAAPQVAEAPAAQDDSERPGLPFADVEHLGVLRRSVLDALADADEPLSVARIVAEMPAGTTRGSGESAIKREFDAGRIMRTSPGHYVLAPARPPEVKRPSPPPPPTADEEAMWFVALEAWISEPETWDRTTLGPRPNEPGRRIPADIVAKGVDRSRKREARRREAEAAATARAAADAELRDRLIAATGGNLIRGPGIEDVSPIRAALELVPLDRVLSAIRSKTDKKLFPGNEPATSWRAERLLREIADSYCRSDILPRLVDAWSKAGRAPAVQNSPPTGEMPDDNIEIDRSHHDSEHAPPGPHSLPGAAPPAPDMSREAASASEPSPAVSVTPEQENSSTVPPAQPDRIPDGIPTTAYVAPTRESVLAAFARNRTPPPPAPQPRPAQPQPRPPERLAEPEPISDEGWEELIAGFMAGMVNWNVRRLGGEPGSQDCRAPRSVLRRFGL
jgi:hypothetical protein